MTTSAKPSSASYVLRRPRFRRCLLAAGLALAVPLAACGVFHSDFDMAVGNRTASTVSVFANGQKIGELGSNLTTSFTLEESPTGHTTIDSTGGPTSPIPVAQVTVSVQDMTTGVLSGGVTATLVKGVTTYVDVAPCVLIGGVSAPPCVSVSGATTGSQPPCTFSLSGSDRSFNATGGTGNLTVNTSSACAWSASSNANWLTLVSGASGIGSGVIVFQVAANTTGQARAATVSVGGQTFTVNQTA
jgi:hypothetical protein